MKTWESGRSEEDSVLQRRELPSQEWENGIHPHLRSQVPWHKKEGAWQAQAGQRSSLLFHGFMPNGPFFEPVCLRLPLALFFPVPPKVSGENPGQVPAAPSSGLPVLDFAHPRVLEKERQVALKAN